MTTQTTHPEHDEGREALGNFDVAINSFIKKWLPDHHAHLLDTDDNDGERLRRTVKRIATDYILAHTAKAIAGAKRAAQRANMLSEYQSLLVLCDQPDATVNGLKAVIEGRMAGLSHPTNTKVSDSTGLEEES